MEFAQPFYACSEENLVKKASSGDLDAFNQLVLIYQALPTITRMLFLEILHWPRMPHKTVSFAVFKISSNFAAARFVPGS